MQHHADEWPARPLAPVRAAALSLGKKTAALQMGLRLGIAPRKSVVARKMLVKMLGREACIALAVEPLDLVPIGLGDGAARAAPKTAVEETISSNRRTQRRNVLSLIPKSSAASSWLNSAASQRLNTSRSPG